MVGQYGQPVGMQTDKPKSATTAAADDAVTIGEALEATALSAGDKPVDQSDAAAIQAAEVRATGLGHVVPGGVGAEAQSAVAYNMQTARDEEKTTLGDVLTVKSNFIDRFFVCFPIDLICFSDFRRMRLISWWGIGRLRVRMRRG